MDESSGVCTLLSITCTTGMTDWVHGDLWLCPDGLLRRSRGWRATIANTGSMGVKDVVDVKNRTTRTIGIEERRQIAGADKRNWWLPWDQITRAKLESGPMSIGLHLILTDGRKLSLRWFRMEGGADELKAAMQPILANAMSREA